jgi:class 3 adenylate cyclase
MFRVRYRRIVASMSETDWSDLDVTELLPTGTVTLLLADVEGSTQLWEAQPAAMTAAVEQLNRTASKLVAEHGGVRPVEQGEGDSFVAAFARASDAVACALHLQRAELSPIKLRVGLHTGEVQLRDEGNYAGSTINKTARLRDLAHGGQTVMSAATEELVEDRLPEDVWLTDLGSHQLRDLPRPMRVAQLCHSDVRNDFPPLRAANASAAQHLPTQLTTFVGRGAQMDEIRGILADNRLVTLTGAGGAGKTRLAIEVAGRMTSDFPDGVWYADLAPVSHPEVVPMTVARALGLPDQPGRSITDTLLRYVRDCRLLMVLDNCEHLLEASAALVNRHVGGLFEGDHPGDQSRATPGARRGELECAVTVARGRGDRIVQRPRPPSAPRFRGEQRQRGQGDRDLPPTRWHAARHRTGGCASTGTLA